MRTRTTAGDSPYRGTTGSLTGHRPWRRTSSGPSGVGVDLWLGIFTDEAVRMKTFRNRWITKRYPLVGAGSRRRRLSAAKRRPALILI